MRLASAHPFIAGFGLILPSGKPPGLVFRAPRETWTALPGAVSGRPVEALINANLRGLVDLLERDGFHHVSEAVGADL